MVTAVVRSAAILAAFPACRQDAGATRSVTIFCNTQQVRTEEPREIEPTTFGFQFVRNWRRFKVHVTSH
jgi:hypothetical protein